MASTLAFADASPQAASPSRTAALGAALLAVACVLGLVEASLPALPVVPWLKLGLANVAVVMALAVSGVRLAAVVSIGRVVIVGLATGALAGPTFVMALAGATASLFAMWAVSARCAGTTPTGWSAAGSAAHVLAQFAVAVVILGTPSVMTLAAPSVLLALPFGALTGYLARTTVSRLSMG